MKAYTFSSWVYRSRVYYQQQNSQAGSRKLSYDVEDTSYNPMMPTQLHGILHVELHSLAAATCTDMLQYSSTNWCKLTIVAIVTAGFKCPPDTLAVA